MKRKGHGSRIPQEFRYAVHLKIQHTMTPFVKKQGMWQHCCAVAKALDVTPAAVNFWYWGHSLPSLYNLVNFAEHYDVSLDYLLGRTAHKALVKHGHLKVVGK